MNRPRSSIGDTGCIILVETTEGTYPDLSVFVFANALHLLVGDMIRQDEVLLGVKRLRGCLFGPGKQ